MVELWAIIGRHSAAALACVLALAAFFKFARWAVEFTYARVDVARGDLGRRVKHLEVELDATREALFLMLNRMAEKYPTDPVLQDVAVILRKAWPIYRDPDADLLRKLDQGGAGVAAA